MPKISERQQLLREFERWIAFTSLLDEEEEEEDAVLAYGMLLETRFLTCREHQEREDHFFKVKYPKLTDSQYRATFRTSRKGFESVLALIENHPIFHNNSRNKQVHAGWQLLVALNRFGHYGNRMNAVEVGCDFGVGAGTVTLYTNRVITALIDLAPTWLEWPNENRREEISQVMREEGFPGCVGFIDGTTIPLSQRPASHGSSYYDRHRRYSINLQVVCDIDGRIIAMHTGCPGASADSAVHQRMDIYKHPQTYFSPGEYLLADSAYALTKYCIPPYKSPAADRPENAAFNYCIARSRVRNEHCIGVLKARWASLKEMRQQIRSDKEMNIVVSWVLACCVLHNMLSSIGDLWTETFEDQPKCNAGPTQTTVDAIAFRRNLQKTALETNLAKGRLIYE